MKNSVTSFTTVLFSWIVLFTSLHFNCSGQDTIRQYPELKKIRRGYQYGDKQINEKEMQTQLVLLGNTEITRQIQLAKRSNSLAGIGYWAIPLGIGATYLFWSAQPSFISAYDPDRETMGQLLYGATFLTISSSVYFKINSDKKNAKAIRLYNEYYQNQ